MADAPAPPKPPLNRIGGCIVCTCEAYSHEAVEDGFRTCTCFHTQWAHKEPA